MELEHEGAVRAQLERLLAGTNDKDAWAEAYGLYNCQFDHPYSNAYCEVFNNLSDEQRGQFSLMSARGARDSSLFLSILLSDVARIGGPEACDVLSHWTRLPAMDAFSPQDALEAFVVSHESLARLKCNLPESSDATDEAASLALRACGTILYWLNRPDVQEGERRAACRNSLQELSIHEKGAALNAIQECTLFRWRLSKRPNGEVENVSIAHFFRKRVAWAH